MLRTGGRVELDDELPADVRLLAGGLSPTSSMLRTGELVYGDEERAAFAAALAFDVASNRARTSLRSSSSIASKDMLFGASRAIVAEW